MHVGAPLVCQVLGKLSISGTREAEFRLRDSVCALRLCALGLVFQIKLGRCYQIRRWMRAMIAIKVWQSIGIQRSVMNASSPMSIGLKSFLLVFVQEQKSQNFFLLQDLCALLSSCLVLVNFFHAACQHLSTSSISRSNLVTMS